MKNTKIAFLYRDASNYKKFNTVILPGEITEEDKKTIFDALDGGEYFIPEQVGLEVERFAEVTEDDHCWCEMDENAFSSTDLKATTTVTIAELVKAFKSAAGNWDEIKYSLTA